MVEKSHRLSARPRPFQRGRFDGVEAAPRPLRRISLVLNKPADPNASVIAPLYTCRRRHEYGTRVFLPTRQRNDDTAHYEDGPLRQQRGGARTADIWHHAWAATGDDGLRALKVAFAAEESLKTGSTADLSDLE